MPRHLLAALCVSMICLAPAASAQDAAPSHARHARNARFMSGRTLADRSSAAAALDAAKHQSQAMLAEPRLSPLSAAWTAVGPNQVASTEFGNVTGRVTAIAIDPADATGNTVYIGTTGGGV